MGDTMAERAYMLANENAAATSNITQQGQIKGIVAFNEDGTQMDADDYAALPASKNSDGIIYVYKASV